ncbi:MAG: uracil-DNA glycosylase [Saprospiraceae bacterium]|nr:uracil-DNA glycosylase [Saprospiraceae bacterium]MBK8296233.1 uracil-DNA glycosylase [Saprospiraceae bacterium]
MKDLKMEAGWKDFLKDEFEKAYFQNLIKILKSEISAGKTIYPPGPLIFNAFDSTPLNKLKVVILGQDPYHGPGEAMGLCFSVPKRIPIPPSLQNIYKELNSEFGYKIPKHGDLSPWAFQGVLLLNASLTVEHRIPNSHKNLGWHQFTDQIINLLSKHTENLVFMLWGNFAKSKKTLINSNRHLVLESVHPSPLAGGKFHGNNHFKLTNEYLQKHGKEAINWEILD